MDASFKMTVGDQRQAENEAGAVDSAFCWHSARRDVLRPALSACDGIQHGGYVVSSGRLSVSIRTFRML